MKIQIVTEGNDTLFLEKYIQHLYPNLNFSETFIFLKSDGVTNLHSIKPNLEKNSDTNGINLIVFDTDDEHKDFGGFDARVKYLDAQKTVLGVNFNYFLFPNHSDNGDYELLLERIINIEHNCLFECFNRYQECIDHHKNDDGTKKYNSPNRKAKIYTYVDNIKKSKTQDKKFKDKKDFLFNDTNIWDLNNKALDPLKEFLKNNIEPLL